MNQKVTIRVKARTPAERAADQFDADLYRLVTEATRNAYNLKHGSAGPKWAKIADALRSVRPSVREMMHENDLVDTD